MNRPRYVFSWDLTSCGQSLNLGVGIDLRQPVVKSGCKIWPQDTGRQIRVWDLIADRGRSNPAKK